MKLSDWKDRLLRGFSRRPGEATRRPDGGTSCYRPLRRKTPGENEMPQEELRQSVPYAHTGFTGMNPPASGFDPGYMSSDIPGSGQQTAFAQQEMYGQQTAYSQQMGYAQQAAYNPQAAYARQTAYSQQTAYSPSAEQAARPERGWFHAREESAQRSNISYMPGYAPERSGSPFNHIEHIMTLTGLKSCYEAIECMKNGETLIVTLDAIANEGESMRCQDMLAGAAFTLGCSVRMLQGARLVLIAPEGVKILPEETPIQAMPSMFGSAPAAAPEAPVPGRRERRSGHNAADWNAARKGEIENYNPYTGTMPVAAGAYGSFGGYGY